MAKQTAKQKQTKTTRLRFVFSGTRAVVCLILLAILVGAYFFVPRWFPIDVGGTGTQVENEGSLVWHTVDVGQGDCTIVQFPDDKVLMVDAGKPSAYTDIIKYLNTWQITTIDWFVITHPHDDHYGAAPKLLADESLKFNELYYSPYPSTNKTYEFVNNYDFQAPKDGQAIKGEDYTITFVVAESTDGDDYPNDASLMMTIEYYNKIFVLTGDASSSMDDTFIANATEMKIFDSLTDKQVILKVAHHCSRTGSSDKFLNFIFNTVVPENNFALISCGKDNSYKHPHQEALKRLQTYVPSNHILITMDSGDIVIEATATTLTINDTEFPVSQIAYSTIFITIGVVIIVLCFCQFNTKTTKRK